MYVGLVEALHVLKGATNEVKLRRLIKLRVASIRDRRRVLYERLLKGILKLRYSSHILLSTSLFRHALQAQLLHYSPLPRLKPQTSPIRLVGLKESRDAPYFADALGAPLVLGYHILIER